MTDHVIHHDPAVVAIVEREVRRALTEAADMLRTEAAEAWGGDSSWLTTGTRVANLAAEWIEPPPEPRRRRVTRDRVAASHHRPREDRPSAKTVTGGAGPDRDEDTDVPPDPT